MAIAIQVEPIDTGRFQVIVVEGAGQTTHLVTLKPEYYEKLTGKQVSEEELIEQSFRYLLEREPKESILREFDLSVIGRYFPNYESEIRRRLA